MNIKQLKPNKSSRYKQSYIDPGSCKKLFPGQEHDRIIYRSSYERKFIYWCESNPRVRYWGSECVQIPYIKKTDGTHHTYNPDFVIEYIDGTKEVVEIKPYNQCVRPKVDSGWLWDAYTTNMSKWAAAVPFCEARGYKFKILTEKTIERL